MHDWAWDIDTWNTRPIEDALRSELAKTQKAFDDACEMLTGLDSTSDITVTWKAYFMGGQDA